MTLRDSVTVAAALLAAVQFFGASEGNGLAWRRSTPFGVAQKIVVKACGGLAVVLALFAAFMPG